MIISENIHDFSFQERSLLKAFKYTPTSLGIRLVRPPVQGVSLHDFVPKTMSMRDLRMLEKVHSTIYYKLPRKGTSIHVLLIIGDEFEDKSTLKECYYDEKTCKEKRSAYRYYHQNLKGKIYRDIELAWGDYRFKIRKKSRREPTENDIWPDR